MSEQPANAEPTADAVHPFEAAGMGKAPFRYSGEVDQNIKYGMATGMMKTESGAVVEFQTKPGGTCEFCGTYIVQMFRVTSADGKTSVVGSECVLKTSPKASELVKKVSAAVSKRRKEKRAAAAALRVESARDLLPSICGRLSEQPHPNEYHARAGKTLLDYVRFMLDNAGESGRLRAASIIEANRPT